MSGAIPPRRPASCCWLLAALSRSPLNERAKSRQGVVPLLRDLIEVGLDLSNRFRPKGELAFATDTTAAHQPCALQHAKVLRDGLPREVRICRKLCDRSSSPVAQLRQERKTGPVPKSREYRRRVRTVSVGSSARHGLEYSSSAPSIRLRSCEKHPAADGSAGRQSRTRRGSIAFHSTSVQV